MLGTLAVRYRSLYRKSTITRKGPLTRRYKQIKLGINMNEVETKESDNSQSEQSNQKHGSLVFVLAGLSIIPLIGVPLGIICILIALIGRKSNSILLASIGSVGILVTVILWGVILPNMFNGPEFSKQFKPQAKSTMSTIIRHIEYYKLQNGRYPKDLKELKSDIKDGEIFIKY